MRLSVIWSVMVFFVSGLTAELAVSDMFSDHAVLQREMKVPVWGWSDAGDKITVSFGPYKAEAVAGKDGFWLALLPAMPADSKGKELKVKSGEEFLIFQDVLVGEVWFCTGQSNMEWELGKATHKIPNANEEIKNSANPNLRFCTVEKQPAGKPQRRVPGTKWVVAGPETSGKVAATAYFFGKALQADLQMPVGMIISSWGGTPSHAWIGLEALMGNEATKFMKPSNRQIEEYHKQIEKATEKLKEWFASDQAKGIFKQKAMQDRLLKDFDKWVKDSIAAEEAGSPVPKKPTDHWGMTSYIGVANDPRWGGKSTRLYNGMIVPVAPYAFRGTAWYQGEADADWKRGEIYHEILKVLVKNWRDTWTEYGDPSKGDWPFVICQLANYNKRKGDTRDHWTLLRECQLVASKQIPNAAVQVNIDVASREEIDNIHPPKKDIVGERLAKIAQGFAMGKDMIWSGPIYKSMEKDGDKIVLHFDHAKGLEIRENEHDLPAFEIAGEDGKFVKAKAQVSGTEVVVSAEQVENPAAVRYAWDINPASVLYNAAGLPASPFRTNPPDDKK